MALGSATTAHENGGVRGFCALLPKSRSLDYVGSSRGRRDRLILARSSPCTNMVRGAIEHTGMSPPPPGGEHEKEFLFCASVPRVAAEEAKDSIAAAVASTYKKTISRLACWGPEAKGKSRQEKRMCGMFTRDLLALADWLHACGVTHVAMESTGVYWKPVWHILEGISNCCWRMPST